jgi:hypothetical protein
LLGRIGSKLFSERAVPCGPFCLRPKGSSLRSALISNMLIRVYIISSTYCWGELAPNSSPKELRPADPILLLSSTGGRWVAANLVHGESFLFLIYILFHRAEGHVCILMTSSMFLYIYWALIQIFIMHSISLFAFFWYLHSLRPKPCSHLLVSKYSLINFAFKRYGDVSCFLPITYISTSINCLKVHK